MSALKARAIEDFRSYVSSGKVAFWQQLNMDLVMGRRAGPYFWDLDNEKRLFNLHCNGGVFNLGHRNEEITEALQQGLTELDIGNGHLISKARADLGRLLAEKMPGDLCYTVYGVSGGEAVDLAIKAARAFTGKTKIISARGGYHGHTGLALAAGDEKYRAPFGPQPPGFQQVPFDDVQALAAAMDDDTAAVILEPIPATLGMLVPSKDYLPSVRALCDQKNTLLIIDEVQTGLGRTGKLWAFEYFEIIPDIVVLGKGLSGGLYPITATVLRKPVETVFHPDPHIHVSTFGGAELGCHVAQRVVEISSDPEFLKHVNDLAGRFSEKIEILQKKHQTLTNLRQLGLFMGLKLEDELSGPILSLTGYQNDLFMIPANNDRSVIQFLPPLTMSPDEVDWVVERLDKALASAQAFKDSL
ncbi:MAG: aspartate aminotransferase family protein [Deltaproteobacteria bacterium]|nr:aspartate aminotransferase family protein [Deltaproteobacteria bacterium]MBW2050938.1 aspartate aminotransferase family protein [Deltaproteobacteria bacterium]MBW2141541.1 aspartate aminotransferase family protein [Deltaproteobacteria bacterium]